MVAVAAEVFRELDAVEGISSDVVVELIPACENRRAGKMFVRLPDGTAKAIEYKSGWQFRRREHLVHGIRDIHALAREMLDRLEPGSFEIGGAIRPSAGEVTNRRRLQKKDGIPDVIDAPAHRRLFDIDKIPNWARIDPRVDPVAAERSLLDLLPRAVARRTLSRRWSSSCAVAKPGVFQAGSSVPTILSAHFQVWTDRPATQAEQRALIQRMSLFAAVQLFLRGCPVDPARARKLIDSKVCEAQQPRYPNRPLFKDGLTDPFPGESRLRLIEGDGDVVFIAELEAELDAFEAEHADLIAIVDVSGRVAKGTRKAARTKEAKAAAKKTAEELRKARQAAMMVVGAAPYTGPEPTLPQVRLLGVEARKRAAAEAASVKGGYKEAAIVFGRCRAILEFVKIVQRRIALGRAGDGRWVEWARDGGIPVGVRSHLFCILASMIALSWPKEKIDIERIRAEIRTVGMLVVGRDWLEAEWIGQKFDGEIVARCLRDADGEEVEFAGRKDAGARYEYSLRRVMDELCVTEDEMTKLELMSLSTPKLRAALERHEKGMRQQSGISAEAREGWIMIARMIADGMSYSQAAAVVGCSRGKVQSAVRALRDGLISLSDIGTETPVHPVEETTVAGCMTGVSEYYVSSLQVGGEDLQKATTEDSIPEVGVAGAREAVVESGAEARRAVEDTPRASRRPLEFTEAMDGVIVALPAVDQGEVDEVEAAWAERSLERAVEAIPGDVAAKIRMGAARGYSALDLAWEHGLDQAVIEALLASSMAQASASADAVEAATGVEAAQMSVAAVPAFPVAVDADVAAVMDTTDDAPMSAIEDAVETDAENTTQEARPPSLGLLDGWEGEALDPATLPAPEPASAVREPWQWRERLTGEQAWRREQARFWRSRKAAGKTARAA